ncbi:magnesium chelatase [Desulfocarbo indianensis]|nr:magnesium chelatase [Desulfocarbo indianensis]
MVYPFSAIVGQEQMKLALLLNAIDPGVGGVLIRGEKGTAKSTTVRSLAALLPMQAIWPGCPFGCDPDDVSRLCSDCAQAAGRGHKPSPHTRVTPVVDLPLNATEDMVLGGLDFSKAVKQGGRVLSLGLLARANRGFLYIDEVNLLDDHLVDVILDAAAAGYSTVEREGVSLSHPSEFVLVGTMNPEEGELRPQLLDRFGLCVQVSGEPQPADRVLLMDRREAFDHDPAGFAKLYADADAEVARAVTRARQRLREVYLPTPLKSFISQLCLENHVAGHRADLAIQRAAKALCAYEAGAQVTVEHIQRVAGMALTHRSRDASPPPPPPPPDNDQPGEDDQADQPREEGQQHDRPSADPPPREESAGDMDEPYDLPLPPSQGPPEQGGEGGEQVFRVGETFKVRSLEQGKDRALRRGSGRRSATRTAQKQGRYIKSTMAPGDDLALDATLRAAAPYQLRRRARAGLAVCINKSDIRCKVREKRVGDFLLFVVDGSGSMGAQARMVATKGAILSLLMDAYQKRDKVAMISFRGREAELCLAPTSSIEMAARQLKELPVGGRTPLSAALAQAHRVLGAHLRKEPTARPIVFILTDGKANAGLGQQMPPHEEAMAMARLLAVESRVKYVVVDTEPAHTARLGLSRRLCQALDGQYFQIEKLKAKDLVTMVKRSS